MGRPRIVVLGVYRLPVTEELFREQFAVLYGYPMAKEERDQAESRRREQLSSTVLVEAAVRNRDHRFDVGDFTLPLESVPQEDWQTAWAEAYLTPNGEALAVERWSDPPASGDLRVAFFLHSWPPDRVLRSSYGDVACPEPQEMPERLARLVPYEPVD